MVTTVEEVREVGRIASGIVRQARTLYGQTEQSYMDAAGRPVDSDTAETLLAMADSRRWMAEGDDSTRLDEAIEVLSLGKTELDVPFGRLDDALKAREWLVGFLAVDNPYRYTFTELQQMAEQRRKLGEAIAAAEQQKALAVVPSPHAPVLALKGDTALVALAHRPESGTHYDSPAAPDGELMRFPRPARAFPEHLRVLSGEVITGDRHIAPIPPARIRRTGEYHMLPRDPDAPVRAHRRPSQHRLRRSFAAAAIALLGAFSPMLIIKQTSRPVEAIIHIEQPERPPALPPLVPDLPLEKPAKPPTAEPARILTPGATYNPAARTGAIMFMVEDDAIGLGCVRPTLAQSYELTKRTLEYMGMSWSQAREISPDTQLKFPPANTMRAWIAEVIGPNACADVNN